jgi:hypothetical protein
MPEIPISLFPIEMYPGDGARLIIILKHSDRTHVCARLDPTKDDLHDWLLLGSIYEQWQGSATRKMGLRDQPLSRAGTGSSLMFSNAGRALENKADSPAAVPPGLSLVPVHHV